MEDEKKQRPTQEKLKDFYEKAKEITKEVAQKVEKQAVIQKLNLELKGKEETLFKNYRLLGERAFEIFQKNPPEDEKLNEIISEIKKINSEIKKLKRKIKEKKRS